MMSLYISDSSIQTPAAVYSSAVRLKESVGLDLIVIDYLQLLRLGRKIESREQEISEISRSLKLMAMELDVPIVALSQLSREVEKRGGRPRMADLRGSGSLEQDADLVFFIYDTKKDGHELILDKQRNGPTGFVKVIMHPEVSRFEEAFPA
jgi:replicative DNA helicase